MPKFEYCELKISPKVCIFSDKQEDYAFRRITWLQKLNDLGAEGWKVVAPVDTVNGLNGFVLMREI